MTFLELVQQSAEAMEASEIYFGHGTDNAWDEAVWLIFYGLSIEPEQIDEYWQQEVTQEQQEHVQALLKQRIEQRIPTAYLLQQAWFAGLPFKVSPDVLIPRSPIAELITNQFQPWLNADGESPAILDLCCGSGCIGLASAHYLPHAHVDLIDISQAALKICQQNIQALELDARCHAIQSNCFKSLTESDHHKYDLIVANPPYVDAKDLAEMPAEYHHEPRLGLEADEDGLRLVREILFEAERFLKPDGVLIVEVGNSEEHMDRVYPELPLTWLEFSIGGHGVFLITAEQLREHQAKISAEFKR